MAKKEWLSEDNGMTHSSLAYICRQITDAAMLGAQSVIIPGKISEEDLKWIINNDYEVWWKPRYESSDYLVSWERASE